MDSEYTLYDLLTPNELRLYAGGQVYERGNQYYRWDRVRIEFADECEARCTVWGTSVYHVEFFVAHDDLGAMCTCPQAESGWFCKHMVAAGLKVYSHLKEGGPAAWRLQLTHLLDGAQPDKRKASLLQPYLLFFSLQPG